MDTKTTTENHVSLKLFAGYELTAEIKLSLNKNSLWKASAVSQTTPLTVVDFQGRNYIGSYLRFATTTMKNLQEFASEIKDELQQYCPSIDLSPRKIQIFPQVFVK